MGTRKYIIWAGVSLGMAFSCAYPAISAEPIDPVIPIPKYTVTLDNTVLQFGDAPRPPVPDMASCQSHLANLYQNSQKQLAKLFDQKAFALTVRLRCIAGNRETVFVKKSDPILTQSR